VRTTNTCTQRFTNPYVLYTYIVYIIYVYRMCVCLFRSGDEFLRDVRPDRTNREFLILLLLFYARALHNIMFKLYDSRTDASRHSHTRYRPDETYERSTLFIVHLHIIMYFMVVTWYSWSRWKVRKSKSSTMRHGPAHSVRTKRYVGTRQLNLVGAPFETLRCVSKLSPDVDTWLGVGTYSRRRKK